MPWPIDVLAVEQDLAGVAGAVDQVVHAVERAQERRFAAARWTDQGEHGAFGDLQRDIEQSLAFAVPELQIAHLELGFARPPARRAAVP